MRDRRYWRGRSIQAILEKCMSSDVTSGGSKRYATTASENIIRVIEDISSDHLCNQFYVAGGTAVALHLGHRHFFTKHHQKTFKTKSWTKAAKIFKGSARIVDIQTAVSPVA
jgi:hypothetical protein